MISSVTQRFRNLRATAGQKTHAFSAMLLLAVVLPWPAFSSLSQETDFREATTEPATLLNHESEAFTFSYPQDWTFDVADEAGEEFYRLTSPDFPLNIDVRIVDLDESGDPLPNLERQAVRSIETNEAYERHFIRVLPMTMMAGETAARVQYAARLHTGATVRALWVARPLPDGRAVVAQMTVQPESFYNGSLPYFEALLSTIEVKTRATALVAQ